ncbi:hypothetical protein N7466_003021 [Penicillium verhagenii]|uniref:uncharacterized protein n=1 Tax=Penicillium verhagenii TaxID=1562060 RepID=UPI0025456FC2|nr:uncharacterized protein N7466_003021 [Penicillium verhagenii]KAJ5936571.1 hypothetical protein N7466_003021 [Penicillium verhagenii]
MDAEAYLKRHGWSGPGNPLNKNARPGPHGGLGLTRPILVARKQNNHGVGKKVTKDSATNQWWLRGFEDALKSVGEEKTETSASTSNALTSELYRFFVRGEGLAGTLHDDKSSKSKSSKSKRKRDDEDEGDRKAAKKQEKAARKEEKLKRRKLKEESETVSASSDSGEEKRKEKESKEERRARRKEKKEKKLKKSAEEDYPTPVSMEEESDLNATESSTRTKDKKNKEKKEQKSKTSKNTKESDEDTDSKKSKKEKKEKKRSRST